MPAALRQQLTLAGDITVPAIGLGCMGLTEFYGHDSRAADPGRVIAAAIEHGAALLDTADAYGPWRNEQAVGAAIAGRRNEVILATKFGVVRAAGQSDGISGGLCGRPDYVRQCCEASLRRLGTDYIDIYYMHRVDPATPVEETAGALRDLIAAGKIRGYGFCEISPDQARRVAAIAPLAAVQSEFSLWHRDPQPYFAEFAAAGAGFVAYSPPGRGFLSGRIRKVEDFAHDDWRRLSPRFQGESFRRNLELVDRLADLAAARGCTTAQLALAWIRAVHPRAVILSGATSVEQLVENLGALEIALDEAELAELDRCVPYAGFAGQSWPAESVGARR